MDSLITSAISLAAGGWDKVKSPQIITGSAGGSTIKIAVTTWKLGILSINQPGNYSTNYGWAMPLQLVAPGTQFRHGTHTDSGFINMSTTEIAVKLVTFTGLLFTWD